jgi:hypothetical protein
MSCGLSDEQAAVLRFLLKKRCMSEKCSKRYEALRSQIRPPIDDPGQILDSLVQLGLVGCKKKKSTNYWICAGRTIALLKEHGFTIDIGREHHM